MIGDLLTRLSGNPILLTAAVMLAVVFSLSFIKKILKLLAVLSVVAVVVVLYLLLTDAPPQVMEIVSAVGESTGLPKGGGNMDSWKQATDGILELTHQEFKQEEVLKTLNRLLETDDPLLRESLDSAITTEEIRRRLEQDVREMLEVRSRRHD
ncbi:MAG: hypothetical protein D6681_17025 [Calditrichaeota bacterium]|nr:MAG: hypothetical protein D6681_17025 [Calditrichota bacterium]